MLIALMGTDVQRLVLSACLLRHDLLAIVKNVTVYDSLLVGELTL